jgi:hypothetical protein
MLGSYFLKRGNRSMRGLPLPGVKLSVGLRRQMSRVEHACKSRRSEHKRERSDDPVDDPATLLGHEGVGAFARHTEPGAVARGRSLVTTLHRLLGA